MPILEKKINFNHNKSTKQFQSQLRTSTRPGHANQLTSLNQLTETQSMTLLEICFSMTQKQKKENEFEIWFRNSSLLF